MSNEYRYYERIRYRADDKKAAALVKRIDTARARQLELQSELLAHVQKTCVHDWDYWSGYHGSSKGDEFRTCRCCKLTQADKYGEGWK